MVPCRIWLLGHYSGPFPHNNKNKNNCFQASTSTGAAGKKPRNLKQQKLAAKVQLMKLKQTAKGNSGIPVDERIYFRVICPDKAERKAFVSLKWTLGKALDSIAENCSVKNLNNVPGEKRLKMARLSDGFVWEDFSIALHDLMEKQEVFNGDSIKLDYFSD